MEKIRKRRDSWAKLKKQQRERQQKQVRKILQRSKRTVNRVAARLHAKVMAEAAEPEGQKLLVKKVSECKNFQGWGGRGFLRRILLTYFRFFFIF